MLKAISFYVIVLAGLGLLVAAVFLVPDRPWLLLIAVPLLAIWSTWLVHEYWKWVRSL